MAGRLLYSSQDEWVHINCALWSAEVYEEVDGTLQNVQTALKRGRSLVRNSNIIVLSNVSGRLKKIVRSSFPLREVFYLKGKIL